MSSGWTLVTGASGFIGGRLVRQLVEQGVKVSAFVRPGSSLRYLRGLPPDLFRLAYGDITVEHTVYRALSGCTHLYHVASNFKMWDPDPSTILGPAVGGTRSVLEAAKKRALEKIVVTSSVAALGISETPEAMDEDHEFNLAEPEAYIDSKYQADQVALEYASAGLPVVLVLPSGVFGPGDWKPTPTGRGLLQYLRFPAWLPIKVPEGGLNVVDVDDVVRGHVLAMERGKVGERYILGGEDVTHATLIDTLSDITGLQPCAGTLGSGTVELLGRCAELGARLFGGDPAITYRLARDYATAYAWVSSAKAERELGYQHRPAKEALARSVRWFLANAYVTPSEASRLRLELRHAS